MKSGKYHQHDPWPGQEPNAVVSFDENKPHDAMVLLGRIHRISDSKTDVT